MCIWQLFTVVCMHMWSVLTVVFVGLLLALVFLSLGLCFFCIAYFVFIAFWVEVPSVLWRCWLGGRKGIRPVKNEWWGAGMVICLGRGADLHMSQLMPLPLTISCSTKSRLVLPFWYRLTRVVSDKGPLNGCCCCCCCFLGWVFVSSLLAKILTGKSISEMIYFASSSI